MTGEREYPVKHLSGPVYSRGALIRAKRKFIDKVALLRFSRTPALYIIKKPN